MLGFILYFFLIIIFLVVAYWYLKTPKNLPPGPPGIPFVGCAPFMKYGEEHLILEEWMERYGKIFSFYMGTQLVVVLADLPTVEEALVNQGDIFCGRPKAPPFAPKRIPPGFGVLSSEGPLWEERRNFILKVLTELETDKSLVEQKIAEEVDDLLQLLSLKKMHAFDIQLPLNEAVANVLCSFVFGQRFDNREVDFKSQMENLTQKIAQSQINFLSPINFFPILTEIPIISKRIKMLMKEGDEIVEFLRCLTKDTKISFNPSEEPANYIHKFLLAKAHKTGKYFDEEHLLVSVFNLFVAGTETVSATLKWAVYFMAKYPDVQRKVAEEIFNVVGSDRLPTLADRHMLPYTRATIMEIQRVANVVPMSVPHRTLKATKLKQYDIPANTLVVPLLWTVLKDPAHFSRPEMFDPTRFLDKDGILQEDPAFIPFSLGKRCCIGKQIAKMEMFLFFTSMISKFKFYFPRDNPNPSLKRVVSMTVNPAPFLVCAKSRTPNDIY